MGELDRCVERLVQQLDAVMLLERGGDPAQHEQRLGLAGLEHLHHLEPAREGGILLDVFLVLAPGRGRDGSQRPARQRRLQEIGRVARPRRAPGADQRVGLVDEEDDRLRGRLDLVDDGTQSVLELPFHAGAGLEQPDVQDPELHVLEGGRHVTLSDPQREALGDRGFPHAGLAGENGVVLSPPHQDVDDLPDLLVAARDGIDGARARPRRQVGGEAPERLLLAHSRRRDGVARLAGRPRRETIARGLTVLR